MSEEKNETLWERLRFIDGPLAGGGGMVHRDMSGEAVAFSRVGPDGVRMDGYVVIPVMLHEYRPVMAKDGSPARLEDGALAYYHDATAADRAIEEYVARQASSPAIGGILFDLSSRVLEVNTTNGWFDRGRSEGEGYALIHSEVAEALEAYRRWGLVDVTAEFVPVAAKFVPPKPEGVGSELADVAIRVLDQAHRDVVPISALAAPDGGLPRPESFESRRLWTFGDWLDHLHAVIATHDLPAILRTTCQIAIRYDIDLLTEMTRKVNFNATRGHRHGNKRL